MNLHPYPTWRLPARVTLAFTVALLGLSGRAAGQVLPDRLPLASPAPDSFLVRFETTKGVVVIKARRAWSPLGVDRLYHLASHAFYDGAVIYRVGGTKSYPGGMVVQFGMTNDSAVNRAWSKTGIADEPVRTPHRRGTVMFARDGPNTRTIELAFDLSPNGGLDSVHYQGVVGFPPIAEVVEGIRVLDSLNRRHGNAPIEHMDSIANGGRKYLDRAFPGLDRVLTVSVPTTWPAQARGKPR
jgi:cyclophilin family peptidyl-prolyl cis-trans isomerase